MALTDVKVQRAIKALRAFEPEDEPYYLCYSGGKDSDCIRILAALAGVKHEIHHNLTTVDAPETVRYVKSIPGIIIDKARYKDGSVKTMWNLIPRKKMPPTRLVRYCCSELKEHGGKGQLKITGVRSAESLSRKVNGGEIMIIGSPVTVEKYLENSGIEYAHTPKRGIVLNFDNSDSRRAVEHCFRTTSTMINPILDWSESDVWQFLGYYGCKSNPLYQCGKRRIGCIGCPMQGTNGMLSDFQLYPQYKRAYISAFDRMLKTLDRSTFRNGYEVFNWWVQLPNYLPGQMSFEDLP